MIVLIILSVVFAVVFGSAGRRRGYPSATLWMFPLAVGSVLYSAIFVASIVASKFAGEESSFLATGFPFFVNIVALGTFFGAMGLRWRQIKALPAKGPNNQ